MEEEEKRERQKSEEARRSETVEMFRQLRDEEAERRGGAKG